MGTAIVQHYRNIRDALDSKTQWVPDGKPLYPLILTLEEWYIFSPRIAEMLNQHVHRLLAEEGISEDVHRGEALAMLREIAGGDFAGLAEAKAEAAG